MRNRKWTALMLAGVMSLSLMACGENAVNSSEEPSGEPVQEATGNETEDGGDETFRGKGGTYRYGTTVKMVFGASKYGG